MSTLRWVVLMSGVAAFAAFVPAVSCGEESSEVEYASGAGDDGQGDVGQGDVGQGDVGQGDVGQGDVGHGDATHGDGTAEDSGNPLSLGPDLMIFTAVIFLVLLAVLRKFAWGPIAAALDDREKGIEAQIAEAHRSNEEARRLLADHETQLAQASGEVKEMLEQARRDAETHRQKVLSDAEAAAQSEKERAVREIHAAKNNALEELAKRSVDQAVGLAGRIVKQQLNQDDHAQLIQDALKQFPSEN